VARTVTAVVTIDGECLGGVGPFVLEEPWWADARPVVTRLEGVLGVPVFVLRLLAVRGSDGARDGHVTYHVEALERPTTTLDPAEFTDDDHPLRLPWARAAGIAELLDWATRHVDPRGRPEQWRTWNLSGLFRLPTADGPVWLKATPPFNAAEPVAIDAVAAVDLLHPGRRELEQLGEHRLGVGTRDADRQPDHRGSPVLADEVRCVSNTAAHSPCTRRSASTSP